MSSQLRQVASPYEYTPRQDSLDHLPSRLLCVLQIPFAALEVHLVRPRSATDSLQPAHTSVQRFTSRCPACDQNLRMPVLTPSRTKQSILQTGDPPLREKNVWPSTSLPPSKITAIRNFSYPTKVYKLAEPVPPDSIDDKQLYGNKVDTLWAFTPDPPSAGHQANRQSTYGGFFHWACSKEKTLDDRWVERNQPAIEPFCIASSELETE